MTTKPKVARVRGIKDTSPETAVLTVKEAIANALEPREALGWAHPEITIVPSCIDKTYVAIVKFTQIPNFLKRYAQGNLGQKHIAKLEFDFNFHGLTQLYETESEPTADVVFITGIGGHAWGSWTSKIEPWHMWPKDFLYDENPNIRTMIWGYEMKLTDLGFGTLIDYARDLTASLEIARENTDRPLYFVAHSFGGNILKACLLRSSETSRTLLNLTRGISFFAVPHKGMDLEDMIEVIDPNKSQHAVMDGINRWRDQLNGFCNIVSNVNITSFYETKPTRHLARDDDGTLSRSGSATPALLPENATLGLPDYIEVKHPISRDHSSIVKFDTRYDPGFLLVSKAIKKCIDHSSKGTDNEVRYLDPPSCNKNELSANLPQFKGVDSDKSYVTQQDIPERTSSKKTTPFFDENHDCEDCDTEAIECLLQQSKWNDCQILIQTHHSDRMNLKTNPNLEDKPASANTILWCASYLGCITTIRALLSAEIKPLDINRMDKYGRTALMIAAHQPKQTAMIELLLNAGANVIRQQKDGLTALMYSARNSEDPAAVSLLARHRTTVNMQSREGATALSMASGNPNDAEVIRVLIAAGAEIDLQAFDGRTALVEAVANKKYSAVRALIEAGADLNLGDSDSRTPLMVAAKTQCPKILRLLLDTGANINSRDWSNTTALMIAAKSGGSSIEMQMLVDAGAEVDLINEFGQTALATATMNSNRCALKILLKSGANPNRARQGSRTALMWAACTSELTDAVRTLINAGANLDSQDGDGKTALMLAVENCARYGIRTRSSSDMNTQYASTISSVEDLATIEFLRRKSQNRTHVPIDQALMSSANGVSSSFKGSNLHKEHARFLRTITTLIESGANLNLQDKNQQTALMIAAQLSECPELTKILIDAGANPLIRDKNQMTALMMAVQLYNKLDIVKLLIQTKATLNTQGSNNHNALMLALLNDDADSARILIKAGAALDLKNDQGDSALLMACQEGISLNYFKLLVDNRANLELRAKDGSTALIRAVQRGQKGKIVLLVNAGAKLNSRDIEGCTALMHAIKIPSYKIVRYLVEKGADMRSKNVQGMTAIRIARNAGLWEIVKYLKRATG